MTARSACALVLALSAASLACSNEGEPGSCYRTPDNACVEYGKAMAGAGKRLCSGFKWTPGAQSCPHDSRLGTCIKERGAVSEILYAGVPNNYNAGSAKNACEFKGGMFTSASRPDAGR